MVCSIETVPPGALAARAARVMADRASADGPALRSAVPPLLGAGGGNSDLEATGTRLLSATVDCFHSPKGSRIRVIDLLAYTDVQAAPCRDAPDGEAASAGDREQPQ